MSALMVYLNPNLTKQEADTIFNESQKKKEELLEQVFENAKELPEEKRIDYIYSVLPYITML